jgi:oligopeptide/dipeptide ABC transporter ATP-binding protein
VTESVLQVEELTLSFRTAAGLIRVLRGVSFDIRAGELVGLVGESGSGKSVTAQAVARLLPEETTVVESGRILFAGRDVCTMTEAEMREIRGRRIGYVFQEPMTALNPAMTVGDQLMHVIRHHHGCSRREARQRVQRALEEVLIHQPDLVARQYPFELSGGMRQRIVIALAMSANPALLIADEPTTALDVTVQAEILKLILRLARQHGTAVLFITHDLGVVSQICERMVVLYAGEVVERGPVREILRHPNHPYTRALLRAVPDVARRGEPLQAIPGELPDLRHLPPGCVFAPRCVHRMERCDTRPALRGSGDTAVACWWSGQEVPNR